MKRLQDIADQVGVSRTTVSNVLHGNTKKVSKEMIRKISEILNQEGYVPNTSSRELTRKGSCIIGLVLGYNCVHGIPSLRDTFVAELLSGVEETAHRNGYPLSKTNAQFRGRNIYANLMIFAMLFNGGMIPTFLVVKSYGLLNTVWALVLPGAVPIFNVILVMNFFAAVPKELEEAAFIDGANPFQVLTKIFIPISKPVLATVSLFSIVGSWNDFYSGLIYMSKAAYYPLMTYIQSLQINVEDLIKQGNLSAVVDSASLGNTNLNAAKIVIAVIPLLLIYPLLQRYFVSGIVVGSVKG